MINFVHDLLLNSVNDVPDKIAIIHDKKSYTYNQIYNDSVNLKNCLLNIGVKKGDRICFYLEKRIEKVVSIFGISMAGGIMVPIRPLCQEHQVI